MLYNHGHITTFDKNHYHFSGPCNYTVTQKERDPLNPDFGVFTSFQRCPYSALYCLHQTTFKNDPNTVVTYTHSTGFLPNTMFTILVNGDAYTVPPSEVHQVQIGEQHFPLLAWRRLNCLSVLGSSGLMLILCPNRLDVFTYPTHSTHLYGLCGYFNYNPLDDMTARDGTVYPVHPFPLAFPESWRTPDQSSAHCKHCRDCTNPSKDDACKASQEQRKRYKALCAKVLHPVLAIDKQLIHHLEACQLELCLLHQTGVSQDLQEKVLNEQVLFAQISKVILARTMGDFVPEPLFAPLDGVCTAGSSWHDDCNFCSCTSGALARCTKRGCLEDFVHTLGEEYCTNGSRWRADDCNVCVCIRSGRVCSSKDCSGTTTVTPNVTFPTTSICNLPRDAGSCNNNYQSFTFRYYYDTVTNECTQFFYSGCGGNSNNFKTEEECEQACERSRSTTLATISPSVCHLRWDPGTCSGQSLKYYYHANTNQCYGASYSGCGGNGNRFDSATECMQTCGDTATTVIPLPGLSEEPECSGSTLRDRWRKDCNWCSCRNGRGTCTRRLCPGGRVPEGPECEGNPTWKDDCNTCHCSNGSAICTSIHCEGPIGPVTTVTVERRALQCEEGARWRVDCNWCVCQEGRSVCTEAACNDWSEAKSLEDGVVECHGDARWKKDCNWCSCINGRGVCTSLACIPPERDPFHNLPENAACVPGSVWKEECNTCRCSDTGVAACTFKGCIPGYVEEGPVCEDGAIWRNDECNTCRCINGTAACSKRLCRPQQTQTSTSRQLHSGPAFRRGEISRTATSHRGEISRTATSHRGEISREPECQGEEEGDQWRQDCNWCRCRNGKGRCTRQLCPEGRPDEEPECEGNVSWKKGCNTCRCVNNMAVCTLAFCVEGDPFRDLPEDAVCVPGSVWKEECNTCRCSDTGVGACTFRGCAPGYVEKGPVCEDGSIWRNDCNTCRCINGTAACSKRLCRPPPSQSVTRSQVVEPECQGDPETDSWTSDCNRCRCNDGRPSCTKRLCRHNEVNQPLCEGNPSWKKDCNHCRCNNGTAVCTTKFCGGFLGPKSATSVQTRKIGKEKATCVDGSCWRVDCNWCTCSGGMGACTEKFCLKPGSQIDEPECEGNSTWKRDCNWCTCGEGMAVCTKMACLKDIENICTEGTSWKEDCNVCRCSQGFVLCTKEKCRKEDKALECKGDSCGPKELPELCKLPSVSGPLECFGFFTKFSFSLAEGKCEQIVYGGCGGSANLFDSMAECEATCPAQAVTSSQARRIQVDETTFSGGDRCTLPKESGPCFAAFEHYAYNPVTASCEEFIYGGCQGNANNFETKEECLAACADTQACDKSKCPWNLWGHYLAKECVPQYVGDACCPTSFQCPSASESGKDPDKCYYKGVAYAYGESVPVENPCSASCFCSESHVPDSPPEITCANVECPELFRPPRPGCRPLYRADQCCPYDYECVDPSAPPLESRAATCAWQNETYLEGAKMYFDDFPCRACICGPGFTDPNGPGCYNLDCGLTFRYTSEYHRGCTPIHFEANSCCPIEFMCPDDSRIEPQQQQQTTGPADESAVCRLGDWQFAVGEMLGLTECKLECRCVTPPELTCIQYRSCEKAQETAAQRECSPLSCAAGCHPVVAGPEECPTCSCSNDTFTCPAQTCPSTCSPDVDLQTGCPTCKCQCPTEVHCPVDCPVHTVLDETTGCPRCECQPGSPLVRSLCPEHPGGQVPCPQDCAVITTMDENGCERCVCDPNDTGNPFGPFDPPPPPQDEVICPTYPDGSAPCPMDCGVIRFTDDDGCERCICNPNDTSTPFGIPFPDNPSNCFLGPDGRAPCPMDCAIRRFTDDNGCEVCECDPAHPGNPFIPFRPPHYRERRSCPGTGQAPCPMDCAIIRYDDENGCEVCTCDPNNPGNPFGPFPPPPRFRFLH